jgi:SAM-dependent methyltransferase
MTAQSTSRVFGFSSPTFSWSEYTRYRPAYPPALYKLIFDYHNLHHGAHDQAHDVGSGAGIVAAELARHFKHVHISDPSEHNLASARELLSSSPDDCEITFSQKAAEERVLPNASVDMLTIFIALHWTDAPKAVETATASLKPGGSLVLLHYGPRVHCSSNARADAAWNRIMDAHSRNIYETPGELMDGRRAHPQSDSGLDYVELSPDVFQTPVRRMYINTEGRGGRPFAKSLTAEREGWFPVLESHVHDEDDVWKWQDPNNWGRKVDGKWFRGYFETIQPTPDVSRLEDDFLEVERAVDEEGGKTLILWSVVLVLATKR